MTPHAMVTRPDSSRRSPTAFLLLTLALAAPIWILSRFVGVIGSLKIPLTDLLLAFTPLGAAVILVWRAEGPRAALALTGRAVDFRALFRTRWAFAALLLAPLIYGLTWAGLHLAGRSEAVEPNWLRLPVLAIILFVLAVGEEVGWTGYLTDPLQARFGALGASLIIAAPWWLGHLPSILGIGGTAPDMAWWVLGAVALRILMTWLYNNTARSVAAVVLFHALLNLGRLILYPTVGSHYDPAYQSAGYVTAFLLALLVLAVFGPRTLAR